MFQTATKPDKLSDHVYGSGSIGGGIGDASGVVIRHNIIEDMGHHYVGEGFYIGGANGVPVVDGLEIYGNVIRGAGSNDIDYKGGVHNVSAHHNIWEDTHEDHNNFPGDGLVRAGGSNTSPGNYFQDNIVRDSLSRYILRFDGNRVDATNNVFYNIDAGAFIDSRTTSSAIITGNTLCNTNLAIIIVTLLRK